jgi:hypothetical protein
MDTRHLNLSWPAATIMALSFLLALSRPAAAAPADACDGPPVIMMVRGHIEDRSQLRAYAEALQASGLYPRLGGYYLNAPAPLAVFELSLIHI